MFGLFWQLPEPLLVPSVLGLKVQGSGAFSSQLPNISAGRQAPCVCHGDQWVVWTSDSKGDLLGNHEGLCVLLGIQIEEMNPREPWAYLA